MARRKTGLGAIECRWTIDTDPDCESWDTDCGEKFCFIDGGPKENNMAFCCYCGRSLKEKRPRE